MCRTGTAIARSAESAAFSHRTYSPCDGALLVAVSITLKDELHQALQCCQCAMYSLMGNPYNLGRLIYESPKSCMLCRPFFLPCFLAALVSLIALVSNTFMLTETLPRIVEAKAACLQAIQKDEQAPSTCQ